MHKQRFTFSVYLKQFILIATLCLYHFNATAQFNASSQINATSQINASTQINEDFSDPDFTSNPSWSGNLNNFEVNAYHQLHLKTTGADTSYLSTPLTCSDEMEWKIWIHLSFAPSENNYSRIYLIADQANPILSDKAFYIQLGEARSADAITLFHKDGAITREVCKGSPGLIANAFTIRIRVVRSSNGAWKISADPTGGGLFASEASGVEKAPLPNGFFGIFCKYTTSNSSGFYFDDISVRPYTDDASPPLLLQALISADNQIQLNFNEPVEKLVSLKVSNFRLTDGTHPVSVNADPLTGTIIRLDFSKPLPTDKSFSLIYQGITDLNGNTTPQKEVSLLYHPVRSFDVLINEIMADPVPSKGLPESEYLELYNRTLFPINLNQWSLQTGKNQQLLPDSTIASHDYLIITDVTHVAEMKKFGKIIVLKTLTLANEGCIIALKDRSRQVIHAIDYKAAWHDDPAKKAGGWSLEMVDPMNPCGESANYRSSIDARGGSPGAVNSVNALQPDQHAPQLLSVFPTDSMHLRLNFSETLDTLQLLNPSAYSIEPSIGQPKYAISNGPLYHSAILELANPLLNKIIYTLTVNTTINDCSGNQLKIPFPIQFTLPYPIKNKCIVINEIMFDPGPDKEEFIEIYNRSTEYYDLNRLFMNAETSTSLSTKAFVPIAEQGQLFSPGEYLILTGNKQLFMKQYPLLPSKVIMEVTNFPALSNEGGVITLSETAGMIIDRANFNPAMHFQMLRFTTGVSLERINPEGESESKDNWHSAAETIGFSTPGKINSQHASQNASSVLLTLEPELFTPDNDGKDDNLIIRYNPEKPGSMMTIIIFDAKGQPIRKLVSNVMLATENTFQWDGFTDNHTKATVGIYVVYAEIYNSTGEVKHFKKTTILASRLKR